MQKKRKVESSLSRLLLNRQKQEKLIIKKRQDGESKRKGLESEFKDLESQLKTLAPGRDLPASAENDDSHQKTYRQLERQKEKSHKVLEKLIAKLEKEEEAGKGKLQDLEVNIREKTVELENLEKSLPEGPDRGDGNGT